MSNPPTEISAPSSGIASSMVVRCRPWLSNIRNEMVGARRHRRLAFTDPTRIRPILPLCRAPDAQEALWAVSWSPLEASPPPFGLTFFRGLVQRGEEWLEPPQLWQDFPIVGHVSPSRWAFRPHDPQADVDDFGKLPRWPWRT
jgi:hypothetical protein